MRRRRRTQRISRRDQRRSIGGCRFRADMLLRGVATDEMFWRCLCRDCVGVRVQAKSDPAVAERLRDPRRFWAMAPGGHLMLCIRDGVFR